MNPPTDDLFGPAVPPVQVKDLTLLDFFAGMALSTVYVGNLDEGEKAEWLPKYASDCYDMAEAMLKEKATRLAAAKVEAKP